MFDRNKYQREWRRKKGTTKTISGMRNRQVPEQMHTFVNGCGCSGILPQRGCSNKFAMPLSIAHIDCGFAWRNQDLGLQSAIEQNRRANACGHD